MTTPPAPNPLLSIHGSAGAELQPYGNTPIVATFGLPEVEYAAIRKSAGLMDLPQRGIIELSGLDRLPFLNNLITAQTWDAKTRQGLAAGQSVYAFLLTSKGRIISDLRVLELRDRTLLELEARLVPTVLEQLEKYRFAEKLTLASRVGSLHEIALHGPNALDILRGAGAEIAELPPDASAAARLFSVEVAIWRDDLTGMPGYHLLLPIESTIAVWTGLVNRFTPASGRAPGLAHGPRLRPIGWAAFNATRIEAGRPLFGVDIDDSILPGETGLLERAVSFTKGCYVGQEIVARMHSRGQVARRLAGIRMDADALPIAGSKVYDDAQNEIGGVTSSTISPLLSGAAIALAYLKRPHFEVGSVVRIPANGAMHAGRVVDLPFVVGAPSVP